VKLKIIYFFLSLLQFFHSYCHKKLNCINFIWFDSIECYQHSRNQLESKKISAEKKLQFINYRFSSKAFPLFSLIVLGWWQYFALKKQVTSKCKHLQIPWMFTQRKRLLKGIQTLQNCTVGGIYPISHASNLHYFHFTHTQKILLSLMEFQITEYLLGGMKDSK